MMHLATYVMHNDLPEPETTVSEVVPGFTFSCIDAYEVDLQFKVCATEQEANDWVAGMLDEYHENSVTLPAPDADTLLSRGG